MTTNKQLETAFEGQIHGFWSRIEGLTLDNSVIDAGNKIVKLVDERDHVSFVEIEYMFEENGFDYKGDFVIGWGKSKHVFFWVGWNESAVNALDYAFKSGIFGWEPCMSYAGGIPLVYLTDGKILNMPVINKASISRAKNGTLKSDRWLPIVLAKKESWMKFAREHKGAFGVE